MAEKTFFNIDELIENIKNKSININNENNVRDIFSYFVKYSLFEETYEGIIYK
jgi:hypothetical protein